MYSKNLLKRKTNWGKHLKFILWKKSLIILLHKEVVQIKTKMFLK